MTNDRALAEKKSTGPVRLEDLMRKWAIPVVLVIFGFLFLTVGLPWVLVVAPTWVRKQAAIVFLWFLLGAFILAVPTTILTALWSWRALLRARRGRDRAARVRALKWVALSSSCLASLLAMELVVRVLDERSYRIPDPKTDSKKVPGGPGTLTVASKGGPRDREAREERGPDRFARQQALETESPVAPDLDILVIGESSARGRPYEPWVSVGQIVGWKLETVFPSRKIGVENRAMGGYCLEQALTHLMKLDRKPHAIILFSGHNEFHARFGWSRDVAYYREEGPESLLGLQELARSISSTTHEIFKNLDRFYGEAPPPPRITRKLVDRPLNTPREYDFVREEFERRLASFGEFCNRIGATAVVIMPGSNDGAYEPGRSVLGPDTPPEARAEFAAAFQSARSAQRTDPVQAIAAFRTLVAQHPEFAESHYRLGQLLAKTGKWSEAAREFMIARDRDALPVRCQSDFRAIFPRVARRYGFMLIDGPAVLAKMSPHGILDDYLYHDAQHLNLIGTIALARDILEQMQARRTFGWPGTTGVPSINLEECARHFEMDSPKWATVCKRTAEFYERLAYAGYDPTDRLDMQHRYERAEAAFAGSLPLEPTLPRSLKAMLPVLEGRAAAKIGRSP